MRGHEAANSSLRGLVDEGGNIRIGPWMVKERSLEICGEPESRRAGAGAPHNFAEAGDSGNVSALKRTD
jgi:hypothetical protein